MLLCDLSKIHLLAMQYWTVFENCKEVPVFSELITIFTIQRDFSLFSAHLSLLNFNFNLRPTRSMIIQYIGRWGIKS